MNSAIQQLADKISAGRKIMVYGAGNQGRGVLQTLRQHGIEVSGFIDRNPELHGRILSGVTVFSPHCLDAADAADSQFIIIATYFFEREVAAQLEGLGFVRGTGYIPYSTLKPRDYVVEVSGACNLHCISCPRAERRPSRRNMVMMDLESFKKVIEKIRQEDPFVGNIQLYQWGEPTMNRSLPEMIRYARDREILCTISSNLNYAADFRAIIEARPECLRISVSGTGDSYAVTHTGGNWETFLSNAGTVGRLRREIYPEMKVELYYHRYRHNTGAQQQMLSELCRNYDFEFHPVPAYLISLDDVLGYCEGRPLPQAATRVREMLPVDLDEGIRLAREEISLPCDALRVVMINADLSVSTCMMYYDLEGNICADDYLATPVEELGMKRCASSLCNRCRSHAIHRYCGVYAQLSEEERY